MKFCERVASDLNNLFGRDLGWEYGDCRAELPRDIPVEIARVCVQYDRLSESGDELICQFQEDERFDRKKTEELTIAVRELLGINPAVSGMIRAWADSDRKSVV